jgi:hypothetical protein
MSGDARYNYAHEVSSPDKDLDIASELVGTGFARSRRISLIFRDEKTADHTP